MISHLVPGTYNHTIISIPHTYTNNCYEYKYMYLYVVLLVCIRYFGACLVDCTYDRVKYVVANYMFFFVFISDISRVCSPVTIVCIRKYKQTTQLEGLCGINVLRTKKLVYEYPSCHVSRIILSRARRE